jgi:hypothetical protein
MEKEMKKFVTKYVSLINLRDLVTSLTASVIILTLIACGGAAGIGPLAGGGGGSTAPHIATAHRSGSHIFPGGNTKPFIAAMFATSTAATSSQLQQSYDAVCVFQPGFLGIVPSGSFVPLAMAGENNSCSFFSGTQPNSGKQTIFDGTLGTLVVTGTTVSGLTFQCRDINTTMPVLDNSFSRAYYDPSTNQVAVFNSANGVVSRVPFACNGIGSQTDQPASIEAQWSKI